MHVLLRGSAAQRLRLASGLVLFTFALTHFLNHALGLVGIDAMTAMQEWRTWITRSTLGGIILLAALLIHASLGLCKLGRRSTLRLPAWELAQIAFGLAIPVLLIPHVVDTRLAHMLFGVNDVYIYELLRLWPQPAWQQTILLTLVWCHACIGLHFWLRLTRWYRAAFPVLLSLAVLVPAAALAGFAESGREARRIIANPAGANAVRTLTHWPTPDMNRELLVWVDHGRAIFYLLLAAVILVAAARWMANRLRPNFAVS